ncbi:hypothetical protein D3C77_620680 [compost metagenome]
MNTAMIATCTATNSRLKCATRFTLRMLIRLIRVTKPATHIHSGTSGNMAER